MIKLIRLEWKKNNIIKYILNAGIMTGVLLLLLLPMIKEVKTTNAVELYSDFVLNICIELLTNASYMVFTSVMLASFVVGNYKNKITHIMFSYPIKRCKIIVAQMLSVWIFNVVSLITAKLLSYGMIGLISNLLGIDLNLIYWSGILFFLQIIVNSIVMISICFITLLIGMIMESVKATVVSSVVLVCLTQGNVGEYTLVGNAKFYFVLLILSIVSVCFTLYEFERKDV